MVDIHQSNIPSSVVSKSETESFYMSFDDAGVLHMQRDGFNGIPEPICPDCEKPIAWCLDMFSFSTLQSDGTHVLRHAQCNWTPERFTTLRKAAVRISVLRRKKK